MNNFDEAISMQKATGFPVRPSQIEKISQFLDEHDKTVVNDAMGELRQQVIKENTDAQSAVYRSISAARVIDIIDNRWPKAKEQMPSEKEYERVVI